MCKYLVGALLPLLLSCSFVYGRDFLSEQKQYPRVRAAINEKQGFVEKKLQENGIILNKLNLIFVVYKNIDLLEVYAKNKQNSRYKQILSYDVCARSGQLGPKRKKGDKQVPEGFYYIDRFNPYSNFYLSLGLNYPNMSDKIKSQAKDLGGDIFIHGSCVTIGCLPMTDDVIKEIYLLAVYAKNNGQNKIPVYIFPFKMTDENQKKYEETYQTNKKMIVFWNNLKDGYDKFTESKKELNVIVSEGGNYIY